MKQAQTQRFAWLPFALALCLPGASCSQGERAGGESTDAASRSGGVEGKWALGSPLTAGEVAGLIGGKVPTFNGLKTAAGALPSEGPLAVRFPNMTEFTFEDVTGWTLSLTRGNRGPKDAPVLELVATRGEERLVIDDKTVGNNELTIDGQDRPGTGFLLLKSNELRGYPFNPIRDIVHQLESLDSSNG